MKYLKNKSWAETTREERYFCAELFFEIRKNPVPFLELIGKNNGQIYEICYEVCFYRDVLKAFDKGIRHLALPQKRTFDLVLLSEIEIIIIEAKANKGFDSVQLGYFKDDISHLNTLFQILDSPMPKISFVAIHSKKYTPSSVNTAPSFQKLITWHQLADVYESAQTVFNRADEIYRH
jgi:hypothetical protein